MTEDVVFLPKSLFLKSNWKGIYKLANNDQVSRLLKESGVPAQDCDAWLYEIGKTLKKGVEIEDNIFKFL